MLENTEKEKISKFKNNIYNKVTDNTDHYDVVLLQLPLWGPDHPPLAHGLLKSWLSHTEYHARQLTQTHKYTKQEEKDIGIFGMSSIANQKNYLSVKLWPKCIKNLDH